MNMDEKKIARAALKFAAWALGGVVLFVIVLIAARGFFK